MKKIFLVGFLVLALAITHGYAQMGGHSGHMAPAGGYGKPDGQSNMEGQHRHMEKGGMMHMCQHMMKHGMMMQNMMQMMKDMMKMQEKMIKGMKPAEKKQMMMEMNKMIGKMDRMMSEMNAMMGRKEMQSDECGTEETKPEEKGERVEEPKKIEPHKH